ncbi:unnamed protein product [Ambrosiozyma monospora]|uniref:Unnamed protein product n=1 Tax=Ambrosiozyma monospora TaxID=43982 RepID=A0ACB5U4A6_AMBMO|nr:unnamed protein product [Ambrosiozyma monospora]
MGYQNVDHAKDGSEVLEKFQTTKKYDLVLMDLQMPKMDGFETTIELKKLYGENVDIVAMSANVYMEERERCHRIGMSGFISKPVVPENVKLELIRAYEDKQKQLSQN